MNKGNWRERLKLFAKAWTFIMVIVVTATLSVSTAVMAAPEDDGLNNGLTQRTPTMTEPNGFSIIPFDNERIFLHKDLSILIYKNCLK